MFVIVIADKGIGDRGPGGRVTAPPSRAHGHVWHLAIAHDLLATLSPGRIDNTRTNDRSLVSIKTSGYREPYRLLDEGVKAPPAWLRSLPLRPLVQLDNSQRPTADIRGHG